MAVKQGDKYKYRIFSDQHGRKWGALVDLSCQDVIGQWEPIKWRAPWYPDQECMRLVTDPESGQQSLFINYARPKAARKAAMDEWIKRRDRFGVELHGEKYDPDKPSRSVLHNAGPAPKPVEPVIAAEMGDPWILGFANEMPAWAIPYFAKDVIDEGKFMRDAEERVKRGQKLQKLQQPLAGV